jgi:hypothetical protein
MFGSKYEWLEPKKKHYIQSSIDWKGGKKWSLIEIPYAIRRYDPYGKIDKNLTLKLINELYDDRKMHIQQIPTDNLFDSD